MIAKINLTPFVLDAIKRVCKALGKTTAHVKAVASGHSDISLGRGADQLRDGISR